jgi:long-chain acyl-CoA synthetase
MSVSQPQQDVAAARAAIDAAIAGKTIPAIFHDCATTHADAPALRWRVADGTWTAMTWREYYTQVRAAALGLLGFGFARGQFGLIMARNRPEHLIADLALVTAGGTAVSLYKTLAPEQIAYIANHCQATVAFVEDRDFLAKFLAIRDQVPHVRHVVLMEGDPAAAGAPADGWVIGWDALLARGSAAAAADPAAFETSWRQARPDDIVALIYTSGTTGDPKGVTYTHANILWTLESSNRIYALGDGEQLVSYLPLAHIAERFVSHWGAIYHASETYLVPEPTQVLPALLAARPPLFVGVPRVWEKFQTGIQLGVAAEADPQARALAEGAIAVGRQVVALEQQGAPVPPELAARAQALAPVAAVLRSKIGLDRCRFAFTSTAPTPLDVLEFFAAIGLPIMEVWGMSELTGPATGNPAERIKLGSVGIAYPGVEVRLGEDGEILVRGGNVMPGYYRDPVRTAEVLDADGWLHSGDVGMMDADGYVRVVDRKKELIITSGGKNVSPANVEALLKHHPLIGQAFACGDGRNYITALLVLDAETLPVWARTHGIAAAPMADLVANPVVVAEVVRAVTEANTHLSRAEQVKRITILPAEWTAESEELTPTLKLRRRVILRKYADAIAGMYASEPTGITIEQPAQVPAN